MQTACPGVQNRQADQPHLRHEKTRRTFGNDADPQSFLYEPADNVIAVRTDTDAHGSTERGCLAVQQHAKRAAPILADDVVIQHLIHGDAWVTGERMAARHHCDKLIEIARTHPKIGRQNLPGEDAEIDRLVLHGAHDVLVLTFVEINADPWIGAQEIAQHGGKGGNQCRLPRSHADVTTDTGGETLDLRLKLPCFVQQVTRPPQHDGTGRGDLHAVRPPVQQYQVEAVFDLADALADRGLRDTLRPSRSGDAALLDDGDEQPRGYHVEHGYQSICPAPRCHCCSRSVLRGICPSIRPGWNDVRA